MSGFVTEIPKHLFEGAEVQTITVGASSIAFNLDQERCIMLQPYGVIENRDDWLYNLRLGGEDSIQSLVGQRIETIAFVSVNHARIQFSEGRRLDLLNDDPPIWDIVHFIVGEDEYLA